MSDPENGAKMGEEPKPESGKRPVARVNRVPLKGQPPDQHARAYKPGTVYTNPLSGSTHKDN